MGLRILLSNSLLKKVKEKHTCISLILGVYKTPKKLQNLGKYECLRVELSHEGGVGEQLEAVPRDEGQDCDWLS